MKCPKCNSEMIEWPNKDGCDCKNCGGEFHSSRFKPVEAAGVQELKDKANFFWYNKHISISNGMNAGEYIDKEDWDKFIDAISTLPQQDSGYWQKLAEAQKEYSLFLENESNKYVQFAVIHGMIVPKEVFEKGEELRKKIYQLEIILSLKQQKGE